MAKLSKVNNNGTLSIVLPKSITEGKWEADTQVEISDVDNGMAILITREGREKVDVYRVLELMKLGADSFLELLAVQKEVIKSTQGLIEGDYTETNRRLKSLLIQLAGML